MTLKTKEPSQPDQIGDIRSHEEKAVRYYIIIFLPV